MKTTMNITIITTITTIHDYQLWLVNHIIITILSTIFKVTCSRIIFQGPALRSCWTRCRSRPVDIPEAAARWHCGGSMKHLALRREIVGNWLGNLM